MLSKVSKILLGVYAFLLVLILLPFSGGFGFYLLMGTGLFTLVTSIFIVNDIKKLKNSLASRIFSTVLVCSILYSAIWLFYGLGGIDLEENFIFISIGNRMFFVLSLIVGIALVVNNKRQTIKYNPNKALSIVLVIILAILFYGQAISGLARLTNSPGICSMHIEMKEKGIFFVKGMKDACIFRVAVDNSNIAYCKQMRSPNACIFNVAVDSLRDVNLCYQITNDEPLQRLCVESIGRNI